MIGIINVMFSKKKTTKYCKTISIIINFISNFKKQIIILNICSEFRITDSLSSELFLEYQIYHNILLN